MPGDVQTETYYADRDEKFRSEKPYELKFVPSENFPLTNMNWSRYDDINVTDIRGYEDQYSPVEHGFQLSTMKTTLEYGDFDDPVKIEQVYMKEVADCLRSKLDAARVLAFDYNIRKSQAQYPLSSGEAASFETPATIVHIDSTQSWTAHMHRHYCKSDPDLASFTRYQYVNLWRPLRGPVKRWPLMLCDWSTYKPDQDSIARDIVYPDDAVETYVIYHNPNHQFYYVSQQTSEEVWIMVQTDSSHPKGVPHTAFPTAPNVNEEERESIEVRAIVYYD
ncbi:hypothetical protein CB0940_10833 [Cercospora beticola]|uniref:CmcJ-like methyltransferase n=1 Tax=Cercospora beticola TaxID=122368 RepID=A0A2G5HT82_CERBT|nr:hypothetical protein CB0940_10833 [Cercospora beticola]PIA95728.1 hypothetical protein CB0940_10833 [Cercospora beticola]WPB07566.1 hypothetical protein RHO25_012227 [Cercospora beticola]